MPTVAVVAIGMAWIPFLQSLGNGSLYSYIQLVQSMIAPAIAAVFMLGIFAKGVTPISGLVGLCSGAAIGLTRLGLQATHELMGVDYGALQPLVDLNSLYFCFILFVLTCLIIFLVSMVTPKAPAEQLVGLTYASITPQQRAEEKQSYGFWEIFHTVVVLAIIAGIYIFFW